jgi:hypothetical protein
MKPEQEAQNVEPRPLKRLVRQLQTFPGFCLLHNVTPTEKRQLAEHLASIRYRETLKLADA